MNYYEEMEAELQRKYPDLFNKVDSKVKSLLANHMHEFLDETSDAHNYCSFIDVYTNKQDAIESHIKSTNKYTRAFMKTVSERHNVYLVYAIDQ